MSLFKQFASDSVYAEGQMAASEAASDVGALITLPRSTD